MAKGDSTVTVRLVGDATDLTKTLDSSSGKIKSFGKGIALGVGGLLAADKVVDVLGSALDKADDFSDAIGNIAGQISPDFAQRVSDISDDFTDIGLSSVDIAKMADSFSALATAAGVSQPAIEKVLPDLIDVAEAVHAQTGKSVDEVVNDIGAAARGNQKAVNDYGIVIDKTLNPDENITNILDQLKAKYGKAADATNDLHGAQDKLNAKWDTFLAKLGAGLDGPLQGVVDFFNHVLDDIPRTVDMFGDLGNAVIGFGKTALAPLGNVRDALGGIGDLIGDIEFNINHIGQNVSRELAQVQATQNYRERNGLPETLGRP